VPLATSVPAELFAAEEELMHAIAHRDTAALAALLADDFVLRSPGQADTAREAFLAAIAQLPGETRAYHGEGLSARALGDGWGVVSGVQVMELRVDGKDVVDRGSFVDVFQRGADGRWRVVLAVGVSLP
jgi:ketosteroid isomerase-like protein